MSIPHTFPQLSTPLHRQQAQAKFTPPDARGSIDRSIVTETRRALEHEMDMEMLHCSIRAFEKAYLPFSPSPAEIDKCVASLVQEGLLRNIGDGVHKWCGFKGPNKTRAKETEAFLFFDEIAKVIQGHRFPHTDSRSCNLIYKNCLTTSIYSELLGADFKVDGCFERQDSRSSDKLLASNIAIVAEYKKSRKDTTDNCLKVASAASHIMNEDPRRMFTFGITVEGTKMSLWYFSRSHSTKSWEFDIMKEPKTLISVFLAFIFGDYTDLGYDPSIRLCDEHDKIFYEYQINTTSRPRFYRTQRTLSSHRALEITGRMTRVWEVVEIVSFGGDVVNPEKTFALKDVWLEKGAQTEREIQERIFDAVEEEKDKCNLDSSRLRCLNRWNHGEMIKTSIFQGTYKNYFMTIECDGRGETTKERPLGAIPIEGLFTEPSMSPCSQQSHQVSNANTTRSNPDPGQELSTPLASKQQAIENRQYLSKQRYFLVYHNVGKALHDVNDLQDVYRAVEHVVYALSIMFIANWVHRDISTGNIIVIGSGELLHGKLSDLEYAKEFGDHLAHASDPKTGTPFFMAHEILDGNLIWRDTSGWDQSLNESIIASFTETSQSGLPLNLGPFQPKGSTPETPVIYNFQHDLESVWWIGVWSPLARIDHAPSRGLASQIFRNNLEMSSDRRTIFVGPTQFDSYMTDAMPKAFKPLITLLNWARESFLQLHARRGDKICDWDSYIDVFQIILASKILLQKACQTMKNDKTLNPLLRFSNTINPPAPSPIIPSDLCNSTSDTSRTIPGPKRSLLTSGSAEEVNPKRPRMIYSQVAPPKRLARPRRL